LRGLDLGRSEQLPTEHRPEPSAAESNFELIVNLTAKAMGVTMPTSVLLRAGAGSLKIRLAEALAQGRRALTLAQAAA
jgi:hypothetical protein